MKKQLISTLIATLMVTSMAAPSAMATPASNAANDQYQVDNLIETVQTH